MQVSLATREASRDRHLLDERLRMLSRQNKTTSITNLLTSLGAVVPSEWSLDELKLSNGQMIIFDFTLETGWQIVDLTQQLVENV
jgi:hypothetical protein